MAILCTGALEIDADLGCLSLVGGVLAGETIDFGAGGFGVDIFGEGGGGGEDRQAVVLHLGDAAFDLDRFFFGRTRGRYGRRPDAEFGEERGATGEDPSRPSEAGMIAWERDSSRTCWSGVTRTQLKAIGAPFRVSVGSLWDGGGARQIGGGFGSGGRWAWDSALIYVAKSSARGI